MVYQKISLPFKIKRSILAVGAQTKNTLCFAKSSCAYLSPIHQDLDNPADFASFEKEIKYFLKKHPKIIACDLHPEYQSTKYIQNLQPITYHLSPIQHHHAHIASCMAENRLKNQKVIGVAFDGTGLGRDNTIWGAEILLCNYKDFFRIAHLREIPLLGGERAIKEPWRLAALWLDLIYGDRFLNLGINFTQKIDKKKWQVLKSIYLARLNSPLASSMGRLFDAVASLVLAKHKAGFEAELAIELESLAKCYTLSAKRYPFKIAKDKGIYSIDPLPMLKQIILALKAKEREEKIACCFHLTVAEMIRRVCLILRREHGIHKVALSGGVFQNKLLLSLSSDLLYKDGFRVFTHKKVSCNDSGISLGQVAVANFRD